MRFSLDFFFFYAIISAWTQLTLTLGKAYIVDGKPMVCNSVENGRFMFTDGRYGFGRTLGGRASDVEILNNLKIAEGVNPQDILDARDESASAMALHAKKVKKSSISSWLLLFYPYSNNHEQRNTKSNWLPHTSELQASNANFSLTSLLKIGA